MDREHYYFMRPCKKCFEMFKPYGKFNKVCPECMKKAFKESIRKRTKGVKKKNGIWPKQIIRSEEKYKWIVGWTNKIVKEEEEITKGNYRIK